MKRSSLPVLAGLPRSAIVNGISRGDGDEPDDFAARHGPRTSHVGAGLARFADLAFRDRSAAVAAPGGAAESPLFTHHQIVELAAPFARQGHLLDLAASDRLRRRLIFRSVRHAPSTTEAGTGAASQPMVETLKLESACPGRFCLTRTLCVDGGLQATLQAEGTNPGDLLAAIAAVPRQRHFDLGLGYRMASSGWVAGAADRRFQVTRAVVQMDALTLNLSVSSSAASAATSAAVEIQPRQPGDALPADLLAVLGWDWSLLQAGLQGWQGSVRLRGKPGPRCDDAQRKLHRAATHLVRTLAEPPPRFHERLHAARWLASLRHAIPLGVFLLLIVELLCVQALRAGRDSPLTLMLIAFPVALLMLFMLRSERPRMALPGWPRPIDARAWGLAR